MRGDGLAVLAKSSVLDSLLLDGSANTTLGQHFFGPSYLRRTLLRATTAWGQRYLEPTPYYAKTTQASATSMANTTQGEN